MILRRVLGCFSYNCILKISKQTISSNEKGDNGGFRLCRREVLSIRQL